MRDLLAVLAVLIAFSLACMGEDSAELELLTADLERLSTELADREAQLAELEAAIAECDCPVDEPEAAPATLAEAPAEKPAGTLGQVEVKSTSAVKVLLDGQPMKYKLARSAYISTSVSPGTHLLEVQNSMAKVVVSQNITVQSGKRTRYQYKALKKSLEQLGTVDAK